MPDLAQRLSDALSERYRVERELGRGGMATVFLAEDLKHRRPIAIKVLDPEVAAAVGPDRFLREIEVVARLAHPHILPLLDSGSAAGLLYYVMPFVAGESLRDRLVREGQLPVEDALRIACEVADALDHAHERGVIHRDVKPENILLQDDHAVVADFGIARAVATVGRKDLTSTGMVVGTPAYMSPEQALGGRELDGHSDLYSLGCVLHEMLAGQPPFTGPTGESIIRQHLHAPPPRIRHVRATVPRAVEEVLLESLAKNPADRPRDGSTFAAALRRAAQGGADPARWLRRPAAAWTGAALLLAALLAAGAGLLRWREEAAAAHRIRTLAVLPLRNASGDPAEEYLADGLTEELIADLGGIGALSVISHASTMRYKESRRSAREIGRELRADGVVAGSVLRRGTRVRVTVRLTPAGTDRQVWARSFERDLGDLPALEGEVARAIAREVDAALTVAESAGLAKTGGPEPAVHEAYLRGLYQWNRRTPDGLRLAQGCFERALALDSTYAPAWVGLSETYGLMPYYRGAAVDSVMPLAKAAALRALALDSTLAGAYAAMGNVEKSWTFDWDAAERYYRRAIALNPGYATAHHWCAVILVWTGRVPEALAEMERARDLDPLSPMIQLTLARVCYLARDYPRAAREYQRAIELDPGRSSAWRGLSGVYYQQGRIREAADAWERGIALLPDSLGLEPVRSASPKPSDYLRRRLSTTLVLERHGLATPAELAAVYAEMGAKDEAFRELRTARSDELVLGDLRALPDYDRLRDDPRYKVLEERLAKREAPAG